jgi:hypothetical protein
MQQLGLSDKQLRFITAAATSLPVEKRSLFLQRLAVYMRTHNIFHPRDDEIEHAMRVALTGLVHEQPTA